jgi:hypothetical protein
LPLACKGKHIRKIDENTNKEKQGASLLQQFLLVNCHYDKTQQQYEKNAY